MTNPVLIMAGGTGGHVFPALAVAAVLKQKNIPVVWMGTRQGIEARLVPEAGYEIHWLSVGGLRGKNKLSLILAPVKLIRACMQAMRILLKVKPVAVLGMGGFVSGPGGLMAFLLRKPLLVHEQNAIPGMTNSLLSKLSGSVMQAFPESFHSAVKAETVGNPLRSNIMNIVKPELRLADRHGALNILVVGGSLGAAALNQTVPAAIASIEKANRPVVWHQAGSRNHQQAVSAYEKHSVDARVDAFIDDMAEAYAWADLVICRAGAMTVSELAMAGCAAVLVPYPYAVDDHQTANAKYLVNTGAAILLPQADMSAENLNEIITRLDHEKIMKMSVAARECAKPYAAEKVAQLCMIAGGLA
jgi:UDP-N-acetylglucosamine--N-acetylmuramyl-(pentapeptide) pyrophosphoryl-undecaprenol N-acetylglucosamine transferase